MITDATCPSCTEPTAARTTTFPVIRCAGVQSVGMSLTCGNCGHTWQLPNPVVHTCLPDGQHRRDT